MKRRLVLYIGYYLLNMLVVKDVLAVLITLPTMAMVLYNLRFVRSRHVVVEDMVLLVIYLFFVIEPLQQLDHGHIGIDNAVSAITYNNYYIIEAAAMVWLFLMIYTLGMQLLFKYRRLAEPVMISPDYAMLLLGTAIVGCVFYILLSGGIDNVLAPRYDKVSTDSNVFACVMSGLQTISVVLLATMLRPRADKILLCFGLALATMLLCYNPFNTARFALLAAYVPLIFVLLRGRILAAPFYGAALFMITIVMPILSQTSRYGSIHEAIAQGNRESVRSVLNLPYLDVWDMLVEAARFTDVNGYTYGEKLLGSVLFIVPRSIWTGKPILNALDIGYQLAEDRIVGTFNLSMFFVGDGFRDGGFVGVGVWSVIVVTILFLLLYRRPKLVNGQPIMHFLFMASVPILTRGPLMAVIAVFFMQAITLTVFTKLIGRPLPTAAADEPDAGTLDAAGFAASAGGRQVPRFYPGVSAPVGRWL